MTGLILTNSVAKLVIKRVDNNKHPCKGDKDKDNRSNNRPVFQTNVLNTAQMVKSF